MKMGQKAGVRSKGPKTTQRKRKIKIETARRNKGGEKKKWLHEFLVLYWLLWV